MSTETLDITKSEMSLIASLVEEKAIKYGMGAESQEDLAKAETLLMESERFQEIAESMRRAWTVRVK